MNQKRLREIQIKRDEENKQKRNDCVEEQQMRKRRQERREDLFKTRKGEGRREDG